jgi:hypothetical protein
MSSVKLIHVAGMVDIYVCALGEKYSSSRDFSKFFCYLFINFQPNIDSTPPPLHVGNKRNRFACFGVYKMAHFWPTFSCKAAEHYFDFVCKTTKTKKTVL